MTVATVGLCTIDTLLLMAKHSIYNNASGDEIAVVESHTECVGGKNLLVAQCLALLGYGVSPICLTGPSNELDDLIVEGVDRTYMIARLAKHHRTWITVTSGQQIKTYIELADQNYFESWERQLADLLSGSSILYVSYDSPWIINSVIQAIPHYPSMKVVTNLTTPLLLSLQSDRNAVAALVHASDTLLMNESESELALQILAIADWRDIDGEHAHEIIVTSGSKGGSAIEIPGGHWQYFAAVTARGVVCSVGAGDAFNGAYVAARHIEAMDVISSCLFAASIAAQKVSLRTSALTELRPEHRLRSLQA